MASSKSEAKEPTRKKLVPRKKLQSVPELLSKGYEEDTATASLTSKLLWMIFLIVMFYLSLEMYLRLIKAKREGGGGGSGGQPEF